MLNRPATGDRLRNACRRPEHVVKALQASTLSDPLLLLVGDLLRAQPAALLKHGDVARQEVSLRAGELFLQHMGN